jgi:hypothetical protein
MFTATTSGLRYDTVSSSTASTGWLAEEFDISGAAGEGTTA